MTLLDEEYTFARAVSDGILLEVTELAHRVGIGMEVFITAALWNDRMVARDEHRLALALTNVQGLMSCDIRLEGLYGRSVHLFPCGIDAGKYLPVVLLFRRDTAQLIILVKGESLDFRPARSPSGGSFFIQ